MQRLSSETSPITAAAPQRTYTVFPFVPKVCMGVSDVAHSGNLSRLLESIGMHCATASATIHGIERKMNTNASLPNYHKQLAGSLLGQSWPPRAKVA